MPAIIVAILVVVVGFCVIPAFRWMAKKVFCHGDDEMLYLGYPKNW